MPVANIFGSIIGKIQEKILAVDIGQVQDTLDTFFNSADVAYLVFMIIGIVGYLTVPFVANYIVNGPAAAKQWFKKVTSLFAVRQGVL